MPGLKVGRARCKVSRLRDTANDIGRQLLVLVLPHRHDRTDCFKKLVPHQQSPSAHFELAWTRKYLTVCWLHMQVCRTERRGSPTRLAGGVQNLHGWGHHSKQVLNRARPYPMSTVITTSICLRP